MDTIRALADISIRRACGFAGLGIGVVMLSLSFDLQLALRTGAGLLAILCLGLACAGWCVPWRDMRRTELWYMLAAAAGDLARRLSRAEAQRLLAAALQDRLLWHAERFGVLALALGGFAWLVAIVEGRSD